MPRSRPAERERRSTRWVGAREAAAPTKLLLCCCHFLFCCPGRHHGPGWVPPSFEVAAERRSPRRLGRLLALLAHQGAVGDGIVLLQHLHRGWAQGRPGEGVKTSVAATYTTPRQVPCTVMQASGPAATMEGRMTPSAKQTRRQGGNASPAPPRPPWRPGRWGPQAAAAALQAQGGCGYQAGEEAHSVHVGKQPGSMLWLLF